MLDTLQLIERLGNLHPQRGGTPDARRAYDNAVAALFQQWQRWLADEYAHDFTPLQQQAIFAAAQQDGELADADYPVVEDLYRRYAAFARTLLNVPD